MKKLLHFRHVGGSFFRLCLWVGLLVGASSVSAQSISTKKVTLDFKEAPIINVLLEIQRQTEVSFAYEKSQMEQLKPVTINVRDTLLEDALKVLLKGTGYTYKITGTVTLPDTIPVEAEPTITCTVHVLPENLLEDPGFDEKDRGVGPHHDRSPERLHSVD